MKSEEKLLLAIGEISDGIIAEASAPYERKHLPMKKTMSIAASVAVVAVGITLISGIFGRVYDKNASGSAAAPEMSDGNINNNMSTGDSENVSGTLFGSLLYLGEVGENSYGFNLTLDIAGVINITLKSADGSIIYTTENITDEGAELRRPTLTVNGESAEVLPSLPGEYDITVSFDGMENDVEWCEYITFSPFGDYRFN